MLNAETKKILNSARDVLVGKVPDPKTQVEQITFAMFYKFMDEKDKEAVDLGGKRQFFVGDFENFSWSKLMDPRLGGIERMDLYTQALAKMSQNPHIAQLFRDIYKDAFIPFRSPETLSLFLKEIDKLDYSNTESLGDAFEYLLSIMGSQGDAGQFRTPRHIIDFIVDVVDPKKTDTILDPACGTAGFLISSYKHIIKQHDGKDDPEEKEEPLTPDEKKGLMKNLVGYDISPDMVRLSKVNMYLHGFPNPTIYEYDTLSSEERWDESFDVILANPPFMSPRGGIKPHKRFSIQANRSEVLFVDYILEHLKPNGRAGVIVPEGIIFQSGNAYKELRRRLVEDGLFAVISLPAGVFQPYSGVKTSILFFDNNLAKKSDSILFVKIESDGFDLGAQRREINRNDLPLALTIINSYKSNIESKNTPKTNGLETLSKNTMSIFVSKSRIRELGDYYLTGERYKEINKVKDQKWPSMKLSELCNTFIDGDWIESKDQSDQGIRLIQTGNVGVGEFVYKANKARYISEETFKKLNCKEVLPDDILISRLPDPIGRACFVPKFNIKSITSVDCTIVRFDTKKIIPEYFLYYSRSKQYFSEISQYLTGASRQRISRSNLANVKILLPPIDVQKQIVEEIGVKQKAIDSAKSVIESLQRERSYFGNSLRELDEVEVVTLDKVCEINRKTAEPGRLFGNSEFIYIDISSVENGTGFVNYDNKILPEDAPSRARRVIQNNDVLLSTVRPNLKAFAYLKNIPEKVLASTGFAVLTSKKNVLSKYIFHLLFTNDLQSQMMAKMGKGSYPSINQEDVGQLSLSLPSLKVQTKLVVEADAEQEAIDANKNIIRIMEQKIQEKVNSLFN